MTRALLLALLLGGCAVPIKLPVDSKCQADSALGYVGQRYTPRIARIVKDKAGATYVRAIPAGTAVTMEFNARRVNLDIDERNTVTRIYCG